MLYVIGSYYIAALTFVKSFKVFKFIFIESHFQALIPDLQSNLIIFLLLQNFNALYASLT